MKSLLLLLLLLAFVLLGSCAPAPPEREVVISETQKSAKQSVETLWYSNERIIQAALDGRPVYEDRYVEACKLFESLIGIPIRGKGTRVGWLPNERRRICRRCAIGIR